MNRGWKVISEVEGREFEVRWKPCISVNSGWKVISEVEGREFEAG